MPEGMQSDAGTELSWSASPTPGPSRPPRATASSVAEDQETLRQLELEHEAVNATDSGERSDEPYSLVGEEGDN
ncbi:hypothetical protein CC80DRAFT_490773 [Byssothecium circinans]|uniref:Uncharacterized protein n=1 Tax=Byssothecium circinans TaxID=147558 RepID=A0A6A5U0H3_9PLEO|nr:hypothetical protein CC80DRAFT_490773 [Byssothecium circinans]